MDAEGRGPDLAPALSPGSLAAGPLDVLGEALAADLAAGEGVVEPAEAVVGAAVAEVTAGPAGSGEIVPPGGPAGTGAEALGATELDADWLAVRLAAVHPAVTRTGTSTSAAAIRRMPPSSPIGRGRGPV